MEKNDVSNSTMNERLQAAETALAQFHELFMTAADAAGQSVYYLDSTTGEHVFLSSRARAHERECIGTIDQTQRLAAQLHTIDGDFSHTEIQCKNCGKTFSIIRKSGLLMEGRAVTAYICMDVAQTEARRLSDQDNPLSGLFNRRDGRELIMELLRRDELFSIVLIDFDDFLSVFDRYGSERGNSLLKTFADTAREVLRDRDSLCRYEDDEFLAILPNCSRSMAIEVMNRVQKKFEERGEASGLRFSFGISEYKKGQTLSIEDMIDEADRALYRAKANKRIR